MPEDIDEPKVENVSQFNAQFVQALEASDSGEIKEASSRSSNMIRRKLRENGYWRHVLPPKPVQTSDLSPSVETDIPRIIENMEPDSPGAKTIPFNDGPDVAFYRGDKFEVYCSGVGSQRRKLYSGEFVNESISEFPVFQRSKRVDQNLQRQLPLLRSR